MEKLLKFNVPRDNVGPDYNIIKRAFVIFSVTVHLTWNVALNFHTVYSAIELVIQDDQPY